VGERTRYKERAGVQKNVKNLIGEFSVNIAVRIVFASQVIRVGISKLGTAMIVHPSATNLKGILPNELCKVTRRKTKSRVGEVVVLNLVVPEINVVSGVRVTTIGQVFAVVGRIGVVGRAVLRVVEGVCGEGVVPTDGRRPMTDSVDVMP